MRVLFLAGLLGLFAAASQASSGALFIYDDGLAQRDEWGRLHQSAVLDPPDLAPRYSVRFHYYFKGASTLQADPAYVGAAQTALRRLGYYCGETDGIYSAEMSDAIARLQKNYGFMVTGNLNVAVRRALHLP